MRQDADRAYEAGIAVQRLQGELSIVFHMFTSAPNLVVVNGDCNCWNFV